MLVNFILTSGVFWAYARHSPQFYTGCGAYLSENNFQTRHEENRK